MSNDTTNKQAIRQQIRYQKQLLTADDKTLAAQHVVRQVEMLDAFVNARNILAYYSLPDELQTHQAVQRWSQSKQLFLPRVNGDYLDILPYQPNELTPGAFNIEEPNGNNTAQLSEMDLIIVPGIAFDHAGNRVGRGKGFYDRLLAQPHHAITIGICYDFQLLDTMIPAEPHDATMDFVITNKLCIATNALFH